MRQAEEQRRSVHVRLAESDLETLYWGWRQELAQNAQTPIFIEWVSNILWEQANAIRHGVGAHAAWAATTATQRERATRHRRRVPSGVVGVEY